jgi:RNA polymerase sigma factor (sigma-70 family)
VYGSNMASALVQQCLQRAERIAPNLSISEHYGLARRAAGIALRNHRRVPDNLPIDPETGFPDSYLDDIIRTLIEDGPRFDRLLQKDDRAWNDALRFVECRVRTYLYRIYNEGDVISPLEELVNDLTLHCTAVLWRDMRRFTFDTPLEAWASKYIAQEVSTYRRGADFRWNEHARSLDRPLREQPDSLTLGDLLADKRSTIDLELADKRLTIMNVLEHLSPDQRELIERTMAGQETPDIAEEMDRTHDAVHTLRHRALKRLRNSIAAD